MLALLGNSLYPVAICLGAQGNAQLAASVSHFLTTRRVGTTMPEELTEDDSRRVEPEAVSLAIQPAPAILKCLRLRIDTP
jgi:hypothetical protein